MTDDLVKRLDMANMTTHPMTLVIVVREAARRIEEQHNRIEQLEAALRPFARVIKEKVTGDFPDDHPAWFDCYSPVVSDFKRAYELVGEKGK